MTLPASQEHAQIAGWQMDLLLDPDNAFDFAQIRRGAADSRFFTGNSAVPMYPSTRGTVWARFRLHNPEHKSMHRTVVVEFANFRRMVFYVPQGNDYQARVLDIGLHLRDTDRGYRYPAYSIELEPGQTQTYYVAISSHSARFPLSVWDNDALDRFALQEFWLQGLLFGIVLCVLVYQAALALLTREREHWSLTLTIVMIALVLLCMLGYQHVYLGHLGDWLSRVYSALLPGMAASIALFSRHFLNLKEKAPRLDAILLGMQWIFAAIALLTLWRLQWASQLLPVALGIGVLTLLAAVLLQGWRRDVNAGLYSLSFAPVVATGSLSTLVNFKVLPIPEHYHTLVATGFALGILMFVFSLAYRIGQVKKQQRALQIAKRQADDRNRIQAEFLANMSHEVRTPLTAVMAILELTARETQDSEHKRRLDLAMKSSEVLLRLFNQTLDFARIESAPLQIDPVRFSPAGMIKELAETVSGEATEKGLAFELRIDPELPASVVGDHDKLKQVILNLLSNALKFTASGRVSLRIDVQTRDENRIQVRIEVEDTGIGISSVAQKNLFQRFVQADESIRRRFGGTGLGLAICRTLVEGMEGRIGVRSAEGQGSTFWVELPLVICADQAVTETNSEATIPITPMRLLVVDDHEINRELIAALLAEDGHAIVDAANGEEAVAKVKREHFDAVLMDVSMPVMDGTEATRQIRGFADPAKSAIPIIGLTAHAVTEKIESFIEAGMDDVLTKPARLKDLRAALRGVRIRSDLDARNQATSILCATTLDSLRQQLGDKKLGSMLVRQFADAREVIATLRAGTPDACTDENARAAHRLAGAFGMLGLTGAGRTALQIEAACIAHNHVELCALLDRLEAEIKAVRPELADIVALPAE